MLNIGEQVEYECLLVVGAKNSLHHLGCFLTKTTPDENLIIMFFITTLPMIFNTSNLYNTVQIKVIEMILFLVLALSNFISSHTWL